MKIMPMKLRAVNVLIALTAISFLLPPLAVNSIILGVFGAFVLIRFLLNNKLFYRDNFSFLSLSFIAYFLVLAGSLLYSENISVGLGFLERSIAFVIIPFIILFVSKKEVNLNLIGDFYINFLCLVFFILFTIAVYRNVSEGYDIQYLLDRIRGFEKPLHKYSYFNYWYFVYEKFTEPLKIQPIYLGLFTNIGMSFLFFLKKRGIANFYTIRLIILMLLVVLCGSRWQLLICLMNYLIFTFFFDHGSTLKKVLYIVIFFSSVALISVINPVTRTRIKEAFSYKEAFYKDDFGGTSIRLVKWKSALNSIKKSFVFGYGIGDSKRQLMEQFKEDKFYLGYYNKYNAHNQYLDTMLAAGIIGLLALLMIFYISYLRACENMLLFFVVNIYSVGFLTESMLIRQWGVISFPFFLLLVYVFYETHHNSKVL